MRARRMPVMVRRPRTRARPRKLEDIEQARLAEWLDSRIIGGRPLLWTHVPNGGARHIVVALQLKAAGLKAGVPDVLIFDEPPMFGAGRKVGVALELKKAQGGTTSDNQERWLAQLSERGWVTLVCHGAEEAKKALIELGY